MHYLFSAVPSAGTLPLPILFSGLDDDEDWMEDPDNWDRPWDEEEDEQEEDEWGDEEDDDFEDFDDEE